MIEAARPISSVGPAKLALWHLLSLVADIAVVVSAVVVSSRYGVRFGPVPNLSVIVVGAALALVSTAAAWLALGPLAFWIRGIGAPFVCLGALVAATILLWMTSANSDAATGTFVAGIAQFLLLQVPYWLLRFGHRLQIAPLDRTVQGMEAERLQYSLWHMLLVMTLVAVALGVGRGVFVLVAPARPTGSELTLIAFFVLLVSYNLLLAWPLIWAVLSPSGFLWKVAAALVLAALVVVVAHPLTISLLGAGEGTWVYWLIFVPQPAYLLIHLLATRISGYRLVRRLSPAKWAQD